MWTPSSNPIQLLAVLILWTNVVIATNTMDFSKSYRDYLKVMTSMVDDFFDPCEDFFQHACGYYDTQVATIAPFMYNKETTVQFLENNRVNFSTFGGVLFGKLYEACKQHHKHVSTWKQINFLMEFSQWPFLHYQWAESGIETPWEDLAARLAAYGIPIFFEVFFAHKAIYLSPADIVCPDSQQTIKGMIVNSDVNLFSDQIADIISSELWFFCQELTGALPLSSDKTDKAKNGDVTSDFLTVLFETLHFNPGEVKYARKFQMRTNRLDEIVSIVQQTEKRIVINFMIWKMLQRLQYEDCFTLKDEFEPLLLSEYWNWSAFRGKLNKHVALASFVYHTTRFQKRRREQLIFKDDWISLLGKRSSRKSLNLERMITKYANIHLSKDRIASSYSNLTVRTDSFTLSYFRLKSRQLRLSFTEDNFVDNEDINHPLYFVRKFINFVIISESHPLFHYFATEDFEMWYNSGILSSSDDYYSAIDCLGRQSEMYGDAYPLLRSLAPHEVENVLKFSKAFHETFDDYHFWLEGEKFSFAEEYFLDHFNLNSSRILFYAVAQLHCGRDDTTYATLINRSYMNLAEFQYTFECDADVPMNPVTLKCL